MHICCDIMVRVIRLRLRRAQTMRGTQIIAKKNRYAAYFMKMCGCSSSCSTAWSCGDETSQVDTKETGRHATHRRIDRPTKSFGAQLSVWSYGRSPRRGDLVISWFGLWTRQLILRLLLLLEVSMCCCFYNVVSVIQSVSQWGHCIALMTVAAVCLLWILSSHIVLQL